MIPLGDTGPHYIDGAIGTVRERVDIRLECLCGRTERPLADECTLVLRRGLPWLAFQCESGRPMAVPITGSSLTLILATPAVQDPDFRAWSTTTRKAPQ